MAYRVDVVDEATGQLVASYRGIPEQHGRRVMIALQTWITNLRTFATFRSSLADVDRLLSGGTSQRRRR